MTYILFLLFPLIALANTFELLDKKLEEIKSLKVVFAQRVYYSWYPKPDVSKGFFYAQKGGKFRIEYEQPERMLIVSDGYELLLYDPKDGSAIIDKVENNKSGTVEALFLLSKPLREVFDPIGEIKREKSTTLILKPKVKDELFSKVYVDVDESFDIKSIKVEDKEGTTTEVDFLSISKNFEPSYDLFKIKVPKGTKIKRL